jgi:hypothetical protein
MFFGIGTFVPQIATIEAEVEDVILTPEQPTGESIAKWNGFVPGVNGGGEYEVLFGRMGRRCFGCDRCG